MPRCIPPFHIQHTGNISGLSHYVNYNTSRGGCLVELWAEPRVRSQVGPSGVYGKKKGGIETRSYPNTWALPYQYNPPEFPTHI